MQDKNHSWLNKSLYPFQSKFFKTAQGKLHYVDEGEGEVILFVHGTPTWSFLYRNQIKFLSKHYRCIAVDHIGFGLSDKPKNFNYHPRELSRHLSELIAYLELDQLTLVVHDFGGPVALPYAIENPDRVRSLVLFNTWLWATDQNKDVKRIDKIVNTCLGKWLYLYLNFSAGYLLKHSFHDKSKLSKITEKHYKKVFPDKAHRYGPYRIAQMLKGASDYYSNWWDRIDAIETIPKLILWGMKDDLMKPVYLEKWMRRFPEARVEKLESGHFPQEEKTHKVNELMVDFISSKNQL